MLTNTNSRFRRTSLATCGAMLVVLLAACTAPTSPAPSASSEPSVVPVTPTPTPPSTPEAENLPGGTFTLVGEFVTATVTVPAGWGQDGDIKVGTGNERVDMAVVLWPVDDDFHTTYTDPCQWSGNVVTPRVGDSVDDLANALAAQLDRGDGIPEDVVLDGYHGKYLELTVPADIDFADCDRERFQSWLGRRHQGPGQVDRLYILDVDGRRLVIFNNNMPGASEADLAELEDIMASIDIIP